MTKLETDSQMAANGSVNGKKEDDVDMTDATNGSVNGKIDGHYEIPDAATSGIKKVNGVDLYPVGVNVSGEGLPYAPINWPNPGDIWSWRTGRRIAASGHHLDRYLYPPSRFQATKRKKCGLASKQAVEHYVRAEFPNSNIKAFWDSFSWKIPCTLASSRKDDNDDFPANWEAPESNISDSQDSDPVCKAGNKLCASLLVEIVNNSSSSSQLMECDICCEEPDFCRDCCCILCCRTINLAHGGYSYFRCEAFSPVTDTTICGHVAHMRCALRAHLAGTLGGSIALDAAYYCRRCDARSDLVPHVIKLIQTCKSVVIPREEIEEILGVGVCILRDTKRTDAKELLHNIQLVMSKLREGVDLEEIWKMESFPPVTSGGQANGDAESTEYNTGIPPFFFSSSDDDLDEEIEQTLLELKKSQEFEYKIAAEGLIAQKKHIENLSQRLDHDKSHLLNHPSSVTVEAMVQLQTALGRMEQVKGEVAKFNEMKEVAKGFGRTPKLILKEHFGFDAEN